MTMASDHTKLLATTAAAAAVAGIFCLRRSYSRDTYDPSADHVTDLNDFEQVLLMRGSAPITTLTWLQGNHEQIKSVLKGRVNQILTANPWLCGSFAKRSGKYVLQYNDTLPEKAVDEVLIFVNPFESSINLDTPADQVNEICMKQKLVLEFHKDFQQPFWRIAIIPDSEKASERFAIAASFSHVAGDGHTFYTLYNMLLGGETTRPLQAIRIPNTSELSRKAMGEVESNIMSNPGFLFSMIRGMILSKLVGPLLRMTKYRITSRYLVVDAYKIESLKREHKDRDVPFVSTNDILAHWFYTNCQAEHGLMALNFRGRLDGHTLEHAGNYENILFYRLPTDTTKPSLIRKSLSTLKRAVSFDEPIQASNLMWKKVGICTNWSSFISKQMNVPGCKHLVHLPVYNTEAVLPSTLCMCVIFQARPDQLAILLGGTSESMKALAKVPFESELAFSTRI